MVKRYRCTECHVYIKGMVYFLSEDPGKWDVVCKDCYKKHGKMKSLIRGISFKGKRNEKD